MSRNALVAVCVLALAAASPAATLKGVQSGTVTIAGGTSSVTDMLSPAVDLTKSFLVFGISGSSNTPHSIQVSGQITNSTTVTFARFGSTGNVTVHWYVAEFLSGVNVQRGNVQLPPSANPADTDVPIGSVDLSKSFPLISLYTDGSGFDSGDSIRAKLTSSTNLRLLAQDAGTTAIVEWQVVEYFGANVQTGDLNFGSTDTLQTATLSPSVDTSKSWLVFTYQSQTGPGDIGRLLVRGVVTDGTTLTFDRNNTGSSIPLTWYLVEFTDQTTVQHNSEPFTTTELQRDVTLPAPINPGSTLAAGGYFARGGRSSFATDDDPGVGWFTFDLTSSTNLRITRGTTGGDTATADTGWFTVDFLGTSCSPLDVTENSTQITVTAAADFKMIFDTTAGGSIAELYDIKEDPGETNDLAGSLPGSGSSEGLHNSGISITGTFYNAGEDSNGRLELLESTSARVRVRQLSVYDEGTAVLTGVRGQGDYSVYPSGKIGLRWTRSTTAPVTATTEYVETFVHKTSSGPLSTWVSSSQTSPTSPGAGDDDFLLSVNENAGPEPARSDILHVLHRDWTIANGYNESADKTNWFYQVGAERENPGWIEETGFALPADDVENWDLLTYFRPRTLVDRFDPAVTDRSADYRTPANLGITRGQPWNDPDQNTASDHFNEAEGAYALELDPAMGLEFTIDGSTTPRFAPFFKVLNWRSLKGPTVRLNGAPLTGGVSYRSAVKPVSRAHFAQDVLLHNTLQSQAAVDTSPDVGSAGAVAGTTTFVAGRYGNGAFFDANNEVITFPSAGNINLAQGAVELWYRPNYDHDDGARHRLWTYRADADNQIFLRKLNTNQLEMQIRTGPNNLTDWVVTTVTVGDLWKLGDWVHLRATWDDTAPVGDEARIFVNGVEPAHTNSTNDYDSTQMATGGSITIGTDSLGNSPALGVIDEFTIYSTATPPAPLAHGGLASDTNEYLASGTRNFTLDLNAVDASRRGEYLYFGADSEFHGLNIALQTQGAGTVSVTWEFWNGTDWQDLSGFNFTDETNDLTRTGTVYWNDDPFNWSVYSVDNGPDLFYVRAHLASGSYTTQPVEGIIKTDILLFGYCGDITANDQFQIDVPQATAVELVSFDARAASEGVELFWETASELKNLGFHLYRTASVDGSFARITTSPIPGLGSSPVGATYRYVDTDVVKGVTYYYLLEDIETTGETKRHGPVAATVEQEPGGSGTKARIAYGRPEANRFEVHQTSPNHLALELVTEGFYAEPNADGSVRLFVPGFDELFGEGLAVPVKRTWLDARAGKKTAIASVRTSALQTFATFRASEGSVPELVATHRGTVRAGRRRGRRAYRGDAHWPEETARIVTEAFQGDEKKALLELAPLRFNGRDGSLTLARRLEVRISFAEPEPAEVATRGPRGRRKRTDERTRRGIVGRLATRERGLYALDLGRRLQGELRLSRIGEDVPYIVRGGVLYFWSEGASLNPYGHEAVFELEVGTPGMKMEVVAGAPGSSTEAWFWHTERLEENRLYQPGLLDRRDPWLWATIVSGTTKDFEFSTSNLVASKEASLLVSLQGTSDFPAVEDHHVRLSVNGAFVGETRWDGKKAKRLELALPPGALVEGPNVLEIANVGDTAAAYSMVMLDRFELRFARLASLSNGPIEGDWESDAEVRGTSEGVRVLDLTEGARWMEGFERDAEGLRFRTEPGRRYAVVDSPLAPEIRPAAASTLQSKTKRADLLVIGPVSFLQAARPLVEQRNSEGLWVEAIDIEDVFDQFGYGERRPEAIRRFLSYAYHEWSSPPRYVLLLGDATYDFKNYLGARATNHVPPLMVPTSYLWTASDPAYASVNGDDLLPDVAIGRLPASDEAELAIMVEKILAYERGGHEASPVVLVTDNADAAGDFRADAYELSRSVLAPFEQKMLHLEELGAPAMRPEILASLDGGARVLSYMGHGGIHLWADENIFNRNDVKSLAVQSEQPLLLTMNCLNGYFHFPYFDSLAEALVTAEDRGAVAAFSPSGLSLNAPAHLYHRAVLGEYLQGGHGRLGDAILAAQKTFLEEGVFPELLSIYHLFGDPTLRLTLQKKRLTEK